MRRAMGRAAAVAVAAAVAAVPTATQAVAASGPGWAPVALKLNNPRQLAFGPSGTLYVAEAGSGAVGATRKGPCGPSPEGGTACVGNTSSVTGIARPAVAPPDGSAAGRVMTGGLSVGAQGTGDSAVGVDSVSVTPGGVGYGIVTYLPIPLPPYFAAQNGMLLRTTASGGPKAVADIGSYSFSHPVDGHEPDSDPYGVLAVGRKVYVADAGNNQVLVVENGKIKPFATFRHRPANSVDGVPTSLALGPGGNIYVGQLGSLVPGQGMVAVFRPDGTRVRQITGLTSVAAVAVDRRGNVYAAEVLASNPAGPPGALVKITPKGKRTKTAVPFASGVAVDGRGNVYVSVFGVSAGVGQVWRGRF